MTPTIGIFTARPHSVVPKQLLWNAQELGYTHARLINMNHCFIGLDNDPYIKYQQERLSPDNMDICLPRLGRSNLNYKLSLYSHIERMGIYMPNSVYCLTIAIDKLQSQLLFAKHQIKTPKTAMISHLSEIDEVLSYFNDTFPLVLKTLFGAGGVGVALVDDVTSFKAVARALLNQTSAFLIQEFIPHTESYRIITLSDRVFAANRRSVQDTQDFRTNASQGSVTTRYIPSQREQDIAFKLAQLVQGHFIAVDYIIDKEGDIVVLEVNGSPGLANIQTNYPERNLYKEFIIDCVAQAKRSLSV